MTARPVPLWYWQRASLVNIIRYSPSDIRRLIFTVIPAIYPVIPAIYPVIPAIYPVIPAHAGIRR